MKKFLIKFIKFLFNVGPPVIFLFWLENQYRLASKLGIYFQEPILGWFFAFYAAVLVWLILRVTLDFFSDIFHDIKNFFKDSGRFNILKLISKIIADVMAYFSAIFMSIRLIPYAGMVLDLIHAGLTMLAITIFFEPGSLLFMSLATQNGDQNVLLVLKIIAALYLFVPLLFYIIVRSEDGLKKQIYFASAAISYLFILDGSIVLWSMMPGVIKSSLIAPQIYSLIIAIYFFFAKFFPVGVAVGIAFFLISIFLYWLPNGLIHFIFTGKIGDAKNVKPRQLWPMVFLAVVLTAAIYFTAWPNQVNQIFFEWVGKRFDINAPELAVYYINVFASGTLTVYLLFTLLEFFKPILRLMLKLFAFRPHRATASIGEKTG